MKKYLVFALLLFLAACTTSGSDEVYTEPPIVTPPVNDEDTVKKEPEDKGDDIRVDDDSQDELEEPIIDGEEFEEEEEIEEPVFVLPENSTVVITRMNVSKDELDRLLEVDEYYIFDEFDIDVLKPATHIFIIYDERLIQHIAPMAFGVPQLQPMDVSVRQFLDKRFTLIYPGVEEFADEFLSLLSVQDMHEVGDRFIPYRPIINRIYSYLTPYGNVGVLTSIADAGESVPFLPRGTHQIFNDPTQFFEADLDTRVIIYPINNFQQMDDLGVPPSRFGKSLEPGDIEGFVDSDGVRTILIRERFRDLTEWFFLSYEVLGLTGKYDRNQITNLFQYGAPLYRGVNLDAPRRRFSSVSVPFNQELSPLANIVAPLDFCRIEQSNRPVSPFNTPDTNKNFGFPLESIIPTMGEINVAIIAVDFPDVPGEEHYLPIYLSQVEILEAWADFVSGGKMKYNVVFPDRWITAPREARYYSRMGGSHPDLNRPQATVTQSLQESLQQLVNASDPYLDWGNIDFVQFVFPIATAQYATDLQGPGVNIQSPRAGTVNFWAWGAVIEHIRPDSPRVKNRTLWDWVAHELLHPQGIVGHAPLNGGAYSIMMDQHAESKALLTWESFLMGHFDEDHIACIDPLTIDEPIHIQLESLDQIGGAPGIKSLMIPVGEFEIVVIEYRTDGPFSTLSPEFQGFTAYYIDVDGEYVRCDWCNPLMMELQNYKRYLRNASEILHCDRGEMYGQPACGFNSIVQYPGYHLDFFGIRLEFFDDGIITVRRLY